MNIDRLIEDLIHREGGYSDKPADRGGPTCWGITESVARRNGYRGDMRNLPESVARAIYKREYWIGPAFDQVSIVSPLVAEELLDTGVNMGPLVAGRYLQRALNVLNQEGKAFPDLVVDGNVGALTVSALRKFLQIRGPAGERVMLTALNCLQGNAYIEIAEARPTQEEFVLGWLQNRVLVTA